MIWTGILIAPGVGEEVFDAACKALSEELGEQHLCQFSFGACWCPDTSRIEEYLRVADQRMYEEKRRFHQRIGYDRRRRNTDSRNT